MVNWSKMYCSHKQPIFSGAIILSWLRPIGKNSMTFLRTTTCYRLLSMQTVGDNLRYGSCPSLWSSRRVLQAHAGSPWVTHSESRIGDPEITATEFPYSSSNTLLLLLRIQRYMWWITTPHVGICVPCGVCNQRTLAKRKRHAKKNTPAIYLFHSDKVHLLNMNWSWDTTQYVSKLVVASSND